MNSHERKLVEGVHRKNLKLRRSVRNDRGLNKATFSSAPLGRMRIDNSSTGFRPWLFTFGPIRGVNVGPLLTHFLLCVSLLVLAGCGKEQGTTESAEPVDPLQRTAEKGPVKMTVRVWPREPRLSDRITMEVAIESEPNVAVTPPAFGSSVGEFAIRDFSDQNVKPEKDSSGRNLRTLRYELEPLSAGTHLIHSIALEFTDKRPNNETKGEPVLLETDPLEIEVTSEWGEATPDLDQLAAMQPPRPLTPSPAWKWVGLAVLLLLAIGVLLYLRTRYRQHIEELLKPPSPEEVAARELKELLSQNLHGQRQYQDFYVRLTGIVRRYIESTTGLRAPEQTTEEFLRDMREKRIFPAERSTKLARFLEAADLVKYAGQQPGDEEIEDSIHRAREFVSPVSGNVDASGHGQPTTNGRLPVAHD